MLKEGGIQNQGYRFYILGKNLIWKFKQTMVTRGTAKDRIFKMWVFKLALRKQKSLLEQDPTIEKKLWDLAPWVGAGYYNLRDTVQQNENARHLFTKQDLRSHSFI